MTVTKRIIGRSEWGARYGNGNDVSSRLPWPEVVVHTEAGALRPQDWADLAAQEAAIAAWTASATEAQKVRAIERFHAVDRGWDGIAYSFFATFDGTIFEGRGWGRSGAHTEGRNSSAAGVCLQGHGDKQPATEAQWAAVAWLIGEGIRLGHLTPRPKIESHSTYSTKGKTCCGLLVRPQLHRLHNIAGPTNTPTEKDWSDMAITKQELSDLIDERLAVALGPKSKLDAVANIRTLKRHLVVGAEAAEGDPTVPERMLDSLGRLEADHDAR